MRRLKSRFRIHNYRILVACVKFFDTHCPGVSIILRQLKNKECQLARQTNQTMLLLTGEIGGEGNTGNAGVTGTFVMPSQASTIEHSEVEDYVSNMAMVPYVIGDFCGCDVVMDEDQILEEIQNSSYDCLKEFDQIPTVDESDVNASVPETNCFVIDVVI